MTGYYKHKNQIGTRLRRVEGQIGGIQRMVEDDQYCIDILSQISAASSALRKVAVELLEDHLRQCVAEASTKTARGRDEKVSEASAAIERLMRS